MGENDSVDSGGFDVPNQIRRPTNAPGAGVTVVDGKCTSPTKSLAPFFFVGAGKDRELRLPLFGSTRWSVCCLVARIAIHPTRAEPFVVSHPPPPIYCRPLPPPHSPLFGISGWYLSATSANQKISLLPSCRSESTEPKKFSPAQLDTRCRTPVNTWTLPVGRSELVGPWRFGCLLKASVLMLLLADGCGRQATGAWTCCCSCLGIFFPAPHS